MNGIHPGALSHQQACVAHVKTVDTRCDSKNIAGLNTGECSFEIPERYVVLLDPSSLLPRTNAIEQILGLQGGVLSTVARHEIQRQIPRCLPGPDRGLFQQSLCLRRADPVVKIVLTRAVTDLAVSVAKLPGPFSKIFKRLGGHRGKQLFNEQHAVEAHEVESQLFETWLIKRHRQIGTAEKEFGKTWHRLVDRQRLNQ